MREKPLSLWLLIVPLVAAGCGGGGPDGSATGGADFTETAPTSAATVKIQPLDVHEGACVYTGEFPAVTVPSSKAVEDAVMSVLRRLRMTPCATGGEAVTLERRVAVTANEHGLLSISIADTVRAGRTTEDGPRFNFDLVHGGALLRLPDLVTPAGRDLLRQTCEHDIASIDATAVASCPAALGEGAKAATLNFGAAPIGLAFDVKVPSEPSGAVTDSVSWARLADVLTPGPLADFAKAHLGGK